MYDPLKAYERCLHQLHQPSADVAAIRQAMKLHATFLSGVEKEQMQALSQSLYAESLLKELEVTSCE